MVLTNKLSPSIYRQKYEDHVRTKVNHAAISKLTKSLKALRKDAETHLQLELESQETFEFLAEQVAVLRRAIISISDVLIDEVDETRLDTDKTRTDLSVKLQKCMKQVGILQSEVNVMRSESDSFKTYVEGRLEDVQRATDKTQKRVPRVERELEKVLKMLAEQQDMVLQLREEDNVKRQRFDLEMKRVQQQMEALRAEFKSDVTALAKDLNTICTDTNQYRARQSKNVQALREHINEKVVGELSNIRDVMNVKDATLQERMQEMDLAQQRRDTHWAQELKQIEDNYNSKLMEMQFKINHLNTENQKAEYKMSELQEETQKKVKSLSNALNVLMDMLGGENGAGGVGAGRGDRLPPRLSSD